MAGYKGLTPQTDYNLVTVSVDRIDFLGTLEIMKDLDCHAHVILAKGSTIIINIMLE